MKAGWIVGVVIVIIGICFLFLPVFPVYKTVQSKKYKEILTPVEEPVEIPVNYKKVEHYCRPVGLFDWELELVEVIENVDNKGGTFTVIAKFYDGDRLAYSASDRKYIGPGQRVTFFIRSRGLRYSTDWIERYSVYGDVRPPMKVEKRVVKRYRVEPYVVTEYKREYITLFEAFCGYREGKFRFSEGKLVER